LGETLLDKLWTSHEVAVREDGASLLFVDRHLLHELTSPQAFDGLRAAGRRVRHPELTFSVPDHIVATLPGRGEETFADAAPYVRALRRNAGDFGLTLFDLDDPRQGIVHVVAPELGLALPGCTLACGDSHTCTVGALGLLAFGIGTSEMQHVLATQCLWLAKPKAFRIRIGGRLGFGVTAKDLALHLIGRFGAKAGNGCCIEFAGPAVEALDMEGRMTLCNMAVEFGARFALIAPDETTFAYLRGRAYAPAGPAWDAAVAQWRALRSAPDAVFDRDEAVDAGEVAPQVTWGTSPEHTVAVDGPVPRAASAAAEKALAYMALAAGRPLEGLAVNKVFIGSCTNGRLSDLRAAAAVARGRHVPDGLQALVVPGSAAVKRAAEAEGLDRIFREAGFEWREPGCSMCAAVNGDVVGRGERCVSTANRNFEGRQGPGSRTHLASPAMAAAAAVSGRIVDVRRLEPR